MHCYMNFNSALYPEELKYYVEPSYRSLGKRYDKARKRLAKVGDLITSRNVKRSELEGFLKLL